MRREGPNFIPLGCRREEGKLSTSESPIKHTELSENAKVEASLVWFKDTPSSFEECH